MTRIRRFLPLLLSLLCTCVLARCATPREPAEREVSTYILVRHAEKDFGSDPVLTAEGSERADQLMRMLKNVDLDLIYSTDTRRTQLTAAPTATDHKLPVFSYDAQTLPAFSRLVRSKGKGKTTLIVGHSNTTPMMANLLTATDDYPRFSELDYTNFYVVTIPPVGKPRVLKMRF